ncbi:hypothetical protein GE09DRAFT_379203 [Coniochaeta sp. 2T2.1]|nr:hypothetical protein GE09DRAFT_379203 [Coniochaeta sp. 2T2.1]
MLLHYGMMVLGAAGAASMCLEDNKSCGQGLPANFCCSPDTQCIALASNTTALCCLLGFDCNAITPITCDVELMNAEKHPESSILTTALDAELPSCGKGTCCPFGYECVATGGSLRCIMAKHQAAYTSLVRQQTTGATTTSQATTTTVATSATVTAHFTTSNAVPLATTTAAADTSIKPESVGAAGRSAGLIAGSVVAAIVLLGGLTAVFWTRRRKLRNLRSQPAKALPPYQNQNQHPWTYQAPAYPAYIIPKTDTMKGSHHGPPTICEALTASPAYVSVEAFAELPGTMTSQPPPPKANNAPSPVELPASPVSFSMWSRQQESENRRTARRSGRKVLRPPRAAFVPLSRFAPTRRSGHPDDGGGWI